MDMPRTVESQPAARRDGLILALVLAPGLAVAGLLFWSGVHEAAFGLAGIALVVSVLIAPEIGLYVYCAMQIFDQMLLGEAESVFTPSKALGPFILLAYALHPQRTRIRILVGRPFLSTMLLFGLYGLFSAVVAIWPLAAFRYGGQIIVQVLLIAVAVHRLSDRGAIARALQFTVLGGIIGALLMVVGGTRSTLYSGATLGEFSNPNSTALALSLPLACIPAAWACTKEKWLRIVLLASAPVILAATLMTGSRAALIAVLFAALLSLALARRAGAVQRILIPAVCVLIIAVTVRFVLQTGLLSERSQARIEVLMESGVHAEEESRVGIWKMALSTFLTRPWGFGYGNTATALEQTHSFFIDIHNTYLSALVDGGAISFILFGYGMWLAWRCVRGIRGGGLSMPAMILFLYVSIAGLTHTIHFSKWFWLPLMFCMLLAEQARRDELNAPKPDTGPAPPLTTADLLRNLGSADAVVY